MKFESIRSSLIGSVFVALASLLLGSCGGGGASSPGPIGGPPQIQPSGATFYAGVEYTMTIAGGRPPYTLSSSEPSLLAVPSVLNGNFFTVVPNNPGVVDASLPPGALQGRTVIVTMRDSVGSTANAPNIFVAQNFMTGYGVNYTSNCTAVTGGTPAACAGGETLARLSATINGNLNGLRTYRLEVLRGPFYWVFPDGQIAGNTITVTTDHEGDAQAIFRVNSNVGTQIAVYRVTDVATGASTVQTFMIVGTPVTGALEIIPDTFTFTGPNTAQCGTGSGDFLVFDGVPPYTATSSFASVVVTPQTSDSQPGRFRLTATNPFVCLDDATIVITDANNNRGTVTVTTEAGSADPPPTPISVIPGALALDCGQAGSFTVTGGPVSGGTFTISMPGVIDPRVTATISGRTITVTRALSDLPLPPLAARVDQTFTFTVTDSTNNTNTTTFGVSAPTACPHL